MWSFPITLPIHLSIFKHPFLKNHEAKIRPNLDVLLLGWSFSKFVSWDLARYSRWSPLFFIGWKVALNILDLVKTIEWNETKFGPNSPLVAPFQHYVRWPSWFCNFWVSSNILRFDLSDILKLRIDWYYTCQHWCFDIWIISFLRYDP
jgi:hypothetical protein